MRRVLKLMLNLIIFIPFLVNILSLQFVPQAAAQTNFDNRCTLNFSDNNEGIGNKTVFKEGDKVYVNSSTVYIDGDLATSTYDNEYYIIIDRHGSLVRRAQWLPASDLINGKLGPVDITETLKSISDWDNVQGGFTVTLIRDRGLQNHLEVCGKQLKYTALSDYVCQGIKVEAVKTNNIVSLVVAVNKEKLNPNQSYGAIVDYPSVFGAKWSAIPSLVDTGNNTLRGVYSNTDLEDGNYSIEIHRADTAEAQVSGTGGRVQSALENHSGCTTTFSLRTGQLEEVDPDDIDEINIDPIDGETDIRPGMSYNLCQQISTVRGDAERSQCEACFTQDPKGVWTALGCIQTDPQNIVKEFITIGLSIAGGVSILMILGAGFSLSTSQGDPKKTSEAREQITSAVIGLLFIIFSITILQFIGVSILRIPGFGG